MFKKPFSVNNRSKVSGADRKKIRRAVEKCLYLASEADLLEQLLPAKAGELEMAKLPAPSRLVIYLLDGVPILLDSSGKSDFVPTVMGLWRCPQLLPQVHVKHAAVSQYIISGADLMLPGVDVSCLPEFQKGHLVSICVPGNPAPIALGAAVMNSMTASSQAQGKGKLIELLQFYGDTLWQSLGNRAVPNAGFLQGVVVPADAAAAAAAQQDLNDEAAAAAADMQQVSLAEPGSSSEDRPAAAAAAGGCSSCGEAAGAPGTSSSSGNGNGPSSSSSWPDDMDQLLELSLLQALHKSVREEHLPLRSSSLWSQHITASRPPGTLLDVKKSSHKKMSTFLQVYSKSGLISTKEDKFSGETILTAVNRSHALYSEFRPYKTTTSSSSSSTSGAPAAAAAGSGSGGAGAAAVAEGPLVVEEVYKPTKEVKPVFEAVGAAPDGYYSAAAAADVAFEYAKRAQLDVMASDNKTLLLDVLLCDALYKGALKKGELYPTHIAKSELREAFLKRLSPQTCISRGEVRLLRKGAVPAVHISGERRQGNKYVTRVVGMETFLVDPAALAAACQKKFACSTSVNDLPGKNNPGQEVLLQGNVIEKLPDYLINTYGIPKKYFLVKK